MHARGYVLLIIVLFSSVLSFAPSNRKTFSLWHGYHRLQSNDERIEPAYYVDDLYGVLGVSFNATKEDLRDAYWKIAFNNHPDRNDTQEALELFRNASHAYNILGKDPKKRAEYDRKINTGLYIAALEVVGKDVLKPFAVEVAIPIINLTAKAIGSIFVPFLRDARDQSKAALDAVLSSDERDSKSDTIKLESFGERLQRMGQAIESKTYEQRIRNTELQLATTTKNLDDVIQELNVNDREGKRLSDTLAQLSERAGADAKKALNATSTEEIVRASFDQAMSNETMAMEAYKQVASSVLSTTSKADSVLIALQAGREEVVRLEAALAAAKENVDNLSKEQVFLSSTLEQLMESADARRTELGETVEVRKKREEALLLAEEGRIGFVGAAEKSLKQMTETEADLRRQLDYKSLLQRKFEQLGKKKDALESVLQSLQVELRDKLESAEMERQAALEAQRLREEQKEREKQTEAIQLMKKNVELRKAELERMEVERLRLLKEADEEVSRLQDAVDKLKKTTEAGSNQ